MNSATSKTRNQGETGSKRSISRTGSLGRAMDEIEPQQLSQSDLAYLRFFLLALHSSMKEVRHSVANRALVMDVCVGIDLLIENAGRRFGFPLLPPGHQVIPPGPRQHLVNQLTLEATPPAAPTFNVQCSTFNAQTPAARLGPKPALTTNPPLMSSTRPFRRNESNTLNPLRQRICGYCGWSWSVGKDGQILCLNPESPHAYDIVPVDLACPEQDPNPEEFQG
jgi:hypothetical protein